MWTPCRPRAAWRSILPGLARTAWPFPSHKLGGPCGAGALLLAGSATAQVTPLIGGGGQERGWRGGTQPVGLIAGFAAAAVAATGSDGLAPLRDAIEAGCVAAGAIVLGAGAPRLPNTSCLALPGCARTRR